MAVVIVQRAGAGTDRVRQGAQFHESSKSSTRAAMTAPQISSSFANGATSYTLPSPVVTVQASIELPSTGYMYEDLHVVSGTIAVATVNPNVLDASGSLTLGDDAGRTFSVTDMAVHVTCAYDETVCR